MVTDAWWKKAANIEKFILGRQLGVVKDGISFEEFDKTLKEAKKRKKKKRKKK